VASFWLSVFEQGLIFGVMVLGVYITYKILDFPDLSVEGSFPLGASVAAVLIVRGASPFIASLTAIAAGAVAGAATGLLHVKLNISNLLSGILVMVGLYSINLRIMGKANIPLFSNVTVFSSKLPVVLVIAIFVLVVKVILDLFLKTKFGFILTATGDNPELVTSLGVDIGAAKIIGLMVSNSFVALSGALMAQYQRFADVGMGTGIVVTGLAAVIMGSALFKKAGFIKPTTTVVLGSVLYRAAIALALKLGLAATDLKLITAVIVVIALSLNKNTFNIKLKKKHAVGGPLRPRRRPRPWPVARGRRSRSIRRSL
jgi:putative ABC transport system permease protein